MQKHLFSYWANQKQFQDRGFERSFYFALMKLLDQGENLFDFSTLDSHFGFRYEPELVLLREISTQDLLNFERGLQLAKRIGARPITMVDPEYPFSWKEWPEAPYLIFVQGESVWNRSSLISIVGSREPQRESRLWISRAIGEALKDLKWTTVSGAARGVDEEVHRTSLRLGLPTVAILPSGLAEIYPKSFQTLVPEILACGGALISEYLPHDCMRKEHFLRRNALIAALSRLTLVIDAKQKSGTMVTAKHAIELGRELAVMPTHPFDRNGDGSLRLLKDGAFPICDAGDLKLLCQSVNFPY